MDTVDGGDVCPSDGLLFAGLLDAAADEWTLLSGFGGHFLELLLLLLLFLLELHVRLIHLSLFLLRGLQWLLLTALS